MFAALILVVLLELLTYGGVLREFWLAAFLLTIAGFAVLFVFQIARGKLDSRLLIAVGAVLTISLLTGVQFGAALLTGVWTWHACRTSPHRILRFLHILLVIGILEALLGLFQYFVEPGWIFGYHNMFNRVSGTLINHNHYAGLLEILAFAGLGLAYWRLQEDETALAYIYLLFSAVMGLAIIFSLSRMGMVSFFLSLLAMAAFIRFRDGEHNIEKTLGMGLLGIIAAGVIWIGVDAVVERYGQLITTGQEQSGEGRPILYRDTFKMIRANPFGVGVGKYQDIFRRYQTHDGEVLFDHAHNDYLETAAEWGVLPAAIFWLFILALVARTVRLFFSIESNAEAGVLLACLGAVIALLIHSLADFNLQIPVNAMLFFGFVGMAAAFPLNLPVVESSSEYRDNDY